MAAFSISSNAQSPSQATGSTESAFKKAEQACASKKSTASTQQMLEYYSCMSFQRCMQRGLSESECREKSRQDTERMKQRAAEAEERGRQRAAEDRAAGKHPSAAPRRSEADQLMGSIGELAAAFGEGARKRYAEECAAKGPPRTAGAAMRGTYENGWSGTYSTWVAIDFDCGVAIFCGAEKKFRDYRSAGGQVNIEGIAFRRSADGSLVGPGSITVSRYKPPTYKTETNKEYVGGGQGWRSVQREVEASPGTDVKEQCKVGLLKKKASR